MQQILNEIAAGVNPSGVLEKVMCRGKKELAFGESSINWSVQSIGAGSYIKSHTSGAVAESSRAASFDMALVAPDYKRCRKLSPDQIYARVNATAGMTEGDAVKEILKRDVIGLTRDMRVTTEKQAGLLLTSADVEYTDDTDSTRNYPCFSGSNPTTHTQSIKLQATSSGTVTHATFACLDELAKACFAKGFRPDALILGTTAGNQILADRDVMELFDRNMNKPGLVELGVEDGGSYLGRVNIPCGASLDVYICNEEDGGTAYIGAKQGVMIASGCCTPVHGLNAFGQDGEGFEVRNERVSLCKRREGIDQNLYMASRALILPDYLGWQIATIAE